MGNGLKKRQSENNKNGLKKDDFFTKIKNQDSTGKQPKKIRFPKHKELILRFYR